MVRWVGSGLGCGRLCNAMSEGRKMTIYGDLSAEEQQLLFASLDAAGIAVSAASLGRKEETASEGIAVATLILDSRSTYVSNPLISSVILELETRATARQDFPDFVQLAEAEGAEQKALGILSDVVALLDAKATPQEAAEYKRWLMQLATATAEAGKEDQGFLGRGGVVVNDAERAALERIREVLGVEP